MFELGLQPHQVCVISGIGCSSNLPGYVNTYGMHTLHGRSLAVATGVKLGEPRIESHLHRRRRRRLRHRRQPFRPHHAPQIWLSMTMYVRSTLRRMVCRKWLPPMP